MLSACLARVEVTTRMPQPEQVSELVRADIGAIRLSRLLVAHKAARPKEFSVVPRGGVVRWDCCVVVDVGEKAYEARANRPRSRRAVPVAHRRGRFRLVVENRVKLRLFGRVDQSPRRVGHFKAAPKAVRLLEIHGARVHGDDAGALAETIETTQLGGHSRARHQNIGNVGRIRSQLRAADRFVVAEFAKRAEAVRFVHVPALVVRPRLALFTRASGVLGDVTIYLRRAMVQSKS